MKTIKHILISSFLISSLLASHVLAATTVTGRVESTGAAPAQYNIITNGGINGGGGFNAGPGRNDGGGVSAGGGINGGGGVNAGPGTNAGGGVGATGSAGAAAGTGSNEGGYMESGSQFPSNMGMGVGGGGGMPPPGGGPGGAEDGDTCPTPQPEEYYCPFPPEARRICLNNQVGAKCPSKCVRGGWCGNGNDSFVGVYDDSQSIGSIDEGIGSPIIPKRAQCRPQSSSSLLTWSQMPALTTTAEKIAFGNTYPVCTYGSVSQATINEDGGWFSITCYLVSNGMVSVDSGSNCRYSLEAQEAQTITSPQPPSIDGASGISDTALLGSVAGSVNSNTTSDSSGGSGSSVINSLYSISGTVTDENGNPLAYHTVFITYNDITRSVTTDANGNFTFSDLSPGNYTIRPANTDTLIFFGIDITINPGDENTSINGLNISGMSLKEVKDSEIAELLRRSSESSGNPNSESGSSLNDWINNVMSGKFSGSGGEGSAIYDEFGNISNVNNNSTSYDKLFSSSSFLKLLSSGYLPLSKSYSPIALSLIPKFANNNAICGDGVAQEGETCDDGVNNGKGGQCSADCLYFGEVRFTDYDGIGTYVGRDNQNALGSSSLSGIFNSLQVAGNELSALINGGIDALSSAYTNGQDWAKQKIMENTSADTRKLIKKVAVVAEEVAKYSVIGVTTLLALAAAGMQVMVYKSQWLTYTVQAGDTIDSLGNKFTMTERALRAHNGHLKKGGLREGMKIKVRNRHFIEKDYLDQLKSVLKDGLEKRHYGHMSAKIDKMFAKK